MLFYLTYVIILIVSLAVYCDYVVGEHRINAMHTFEIQLQ